jgi:hypothetical protein
MEHWCCERFSSLLEYLTDAGVAVKAFKNSDERFFCIETRGFDISVEQELNGIFAETNNGLWPHIADVNGRPIPIVKSLGLRIYYCPKCGAELAPLIAKRLAEFDALALQQDQLLGASR